jgi:hypothetical protein
MFAVDLHHFASPGSDDSSVNAAVKASAIRVNEPLRGVGVLTMVWMDCRDNGRRSARGARKTLELIWHPPNVLI